ncbi:MAG: bifunctional folylpolyglutamate synthase/dihydrofolate synthase [Oscillospiraceae bacterium]|nr:bifunctional folylpolyglutamate synthase/dihydrofolate synthase [Oscillospiraceae bacterium]
MNYNETLEYIHSLKQFGVKPSLERIGRLTAALGNPQDKLRCVHVAGTNGKGSTATMTANILRQAGYKTGLFISPYILNFRERMQINGEMIGEEALCGVMDRVRAAMESLEGEAPNEFEVITAAGLLWFCEQNCDVVVLEVGLGGRYDATNIIPPPLAAVITSIDLDHTHILGDTVEVIAAEKCGIIKPRTPVVCYPDQNPDALGVIMEHCALQGATLHMGSLNGAEVLECGLEGSRIRCEEQEIYLPLIGRHQIANTLTVLETVKVLRQRGLFISPKAVEEGIAQTRFPARLEILSREPLVIVDGAHNPSGAAALSEALKLLDGRPITALCGMLADKDWATSLGLVLKHCSRLVAVRPQNPRALEPKILAAEGAKYCPAQTAQSLAEGWQMAKEYGDPVLVWGSLYLAADLRTIALEDLSPKAPM